MNSLRDLNLNSLRIVECAARTGSFVRAAEEQLISPSAVSQRVKNLEAQLRFKIFNRRNNAVVLTTEGDAFIAHVREALDTILSAGLEAQASERQTMLKISALPTFIVRWLMPRLPDFQENHDDIVLSLSSSYTAIDFDREDFDLAIRYGSGVFHGLESHQLFEEDLTPVCSPALLDKQFPCWRERKLKPEDLRHFTLLHSDTCTLNWKSWYEIATERDGMIEAPSVYFDTCMLAFDGANAGMGFAVANRAYVASDIEAGKLVAPFQADVKTGHGWHIVYPRSSTHPEKVAAFESWIIAQAQQATADNAELFRKTYTIKPKKRRKPPEFLRLNAS